ncbi:Dicarboxylic amino acid permease [Venturia nashicola]|uniref:Dicarboxylic amino acid permease n=1 Tax=Venturia nashicola TaxID=86259 RepID=A0A4Z1NWU1_9PEZI|nr:Dicarboxylic amino acid permease [Venturia nashicola]TLD32158.1 Dicarboxylic amino acid permease [Venturia nashicola]
MTRSPSLFRAAYRTFSQCRPRFSHHYFTTSIPQRASETTNDDTSPSSEEDYDYSWIQDSELNLLRRQRDLLPKPSVYVLFNQKLDLFEAEMSEKIKTNHLLTHQDLEIVHKLRAKLKIAEENNRKRVRLFDEIIRETDEEHKRVRARLPKRKALTTRHSAMDKGQR